MKRMFCCIDIHSSSRCSSAGDPWLRCFRCLCLGIIGAGPARWRVQVFQWPLGPAGRRTEAPGPLASVWQWEGCLGKSPAVESTQLFGRGHLLRQRVR